MRKYFFLILSIFLIVPGILFFSHKNDDDNLSICIFANWIPNEIIENFQSETGIKVKVNYCFDCDELEAKLLTGSPKYDVILMSAWPYVDRGKKIQLYKHIDKDDIEAMEEIDPDILKKVHLLGQKKLVGVPFVWGTIALSFHDNIKRSESFLLNINDVKDIAKEHKIIIIDSATEIIHIFCKLMGHDFLKCTEAELLKVFKHLKKIRPYLLFDSDNFRNNLNNGYYPCAIGLSDDILSSSERNNIVDMKDPLIWMDMLMIPKRSKNYDKAIKFINYLLREDVYKKILLKTNGFSVFDLNKEKRLVLAKSSYDKRLPYKKEKLIRKLWQELKLNL